MPDDLKRECLNEIGGYLVNAILESCAAQVSPVTNRPFIKLSDDYKEKKESMGEPGVPNLWLNGDMLPSLDYEISDDSIEIGVFDESEAPKAYNHNVGDTLPQRQFIAGDDERFSRPIEAGITEIIDSYIAKFLSEEISEIKVRTPTIRREVTAQTINVGDLLDFGAFD